MSKNPYPNTNKTRLELTIDLFHSLRIIKDSLNMLKNGNYYHLGVIYKELRSLLTDKSPKGVSPLLPLISEYLKCDLEFYCKKAKPLLKNAHFEYINHELSLKKISDKHTKTDINSYLNETAIIVEGHEIKVHELIGHLSNTYGGAHYSSKFPEYLSMLKNFKLGEHTVFDTYVIQLAELCLQLGITLLKKITDFNIYLYIYLPKINSNKEEAIIDFKHINTSNRVTLYFKDNKYYFSLVDSIGRHFNELTKGIITPDQYHIINLSHNITYGLESNFKFFLNNKLEINKTQHNPFIFLNELIHFERYINKFYNQKNTHLEFGFIYYGFMDKEIDSTENIANYNQIKNNCDSSGATWLEKNIYGYCKSGETDLKIEGGKNVNIKEFLKNREK